jgi:membrane protein required for colicin V production
MTSVDLAVLVVMILSGLLAFSRGLVREVLSIGAWVGALLIAVTGVSMIRPIARRWIADPDWADIASYGALFLVSLIILSVVAKAIGNAVRSSAVSGVDRSLGLLFGLARGAVLAMIAYFFACLAIPPDRWPQPVLESRSLPYIYTGAAWVVRQIPQEYRPQVPPPPPPSRQTALDGVLRASPIGRASDAPHSK